MTTKKRNITLYLNESVYEWLVVYERSTEDWQRCYYRGDIDWAVKFYEENTTNDK